MSSSNLAQKQTGFTIPELIVAMVVAAILATFVFGFFSSTLDQYFNLQQTSVQFGNLAMESERVAMVLRGLTGINSATASDLQVYAYFSPNDTYVSLVHYYISGSALKADVTHMTANPPVGSLITSSKSTYTILPNFYSVSGVNLFNYYDGNSNLLTPPISNLDTIKNVQINLSVPAPGSTTNKYSSISTTVSLRNFKTNL